MTSCILCGSEHTVEKQKINVQEVIDCYHDTKDIDVRSEFSESAHLHYHSCKRCELGFFTPTVNGSANFYDQIQYSHNSYYSEVRPEFIKAKDYISSEDSILEIGAGNGSFAKLLETNNYTGLEYSEETIREAKKNNINLQKYSIEDFVSKTDKKFDVICSFHVLEHIERPDDFIGSCLQLLKKNGKLILAVPCCDSLLTVNFNHTLNMPPHHLTRWSANTFRFLEKLFDLKIINLHVDALDSAKKRTYYEFLLAKRISKFFFPKREVIFYKKSYFNILKWVKKFNRKLKLYQRADSSHWVGENMLIVLEKK